MCNELRAGGVLLLVIFLFASGIYRLERARKSFGTNTMSPEHLPFILKGMVRTVQAEGDWGRVEFMRDEVRKALQTLDRLRHDPTNEILRASKKRREAQS